MASSTGWRPYKTSIPQVYFLNGNVAAGLECFLGSTLTQPSPFKTIFRVNISFFMDPSTKKRVFSARKNVSDTVLTGSITLSAAQTAQVQSENAAIAHGLKRQNPELLDQLIELYQHRLLRYLLFLTGKREVAEDLFQETWMRVLLRGAQYNGKARFDTWLFTIARNLVIDLSRKRTMASLDEMSEGGDDERPFEIAMSAPSPLEQFQSREDCAEVGEVLLKLEPTYREVLVLRFYEELSLEEIATVTRAPLSTVKSRLYRGLAALKPQMEQLRGSHSFAEAGV
jgi:RNA polymerase sigma-70 factor, ECF subfamily